MRFSKTGWLALICFCLLAGCAAAAEEDTDADYEETKKMMVDLLKTDDGKTAIKDILSDDSMKEMIVMDQETVKNAIENSLDSENGKAFWEEMMQDPDFAKALAKSMQKENEELLKTLMKDPEYQTMLMDVLQDPEMEKATLELMKSKQYRQQVMTIMNEALESPAFADKITKMLEDVAEKQMSKEEGKGGEEEGGGGGGG